jgi:hypothetical protein
MACAFTEKKLNHVRLKIHGLSTPKGMPMYNTVVIARESILFLDADRGNLRF